MRAAARSTAPTSTSGTRTPTASTPTRASRRGGTRRTAARTSCAATRSPASTPAPARRRWTARSTSRRSGRAGTPAARSTSTCASAPTTAARSRRTTRRRSSSPTPTTRRCSRRGALQHALAEDRSDDGRDRQRAPAGLGATPTNIVSVTGSIADGFAATFTIGLSGVASNASAGESTDTNGRGEPRLGEGGEVRERRAHARPLGSRGREADGAREPRPRRQDARQGDRSAGGRDADAARGDPDGRRRRGGDREAHARRRRRQHEEPVEEGRRFPPDQLPSSGSPLSSHSRQIHSAPRASPALSAGRNHRHAAHGADRQGGRRPCAPV